MIKRKFDSDSIKNLNKDISEYFLVLDRYRESAENYKISCNINLNDSYINYLQDELYKTFTEGKYKFCFDSLTPLYNYFYRYKRLKEFSAECAKNHSLNFSNFKIKLRDLEKVNKFFWVFYSKDKKEELNNNYDYLVHFLTEFNYNDLEDRYNLLLEKPENSDLLDDIKSDRNYYNSSISNLVYSNNLSHVVFKPFKKLIDGYEEIGLLINTIESNINTASYINRLKEDVITSAKAYYNSLADKQLKNLDNFPIEMLINQSGLSQSVVSKLRGGGYSTIGDLKRVTKYHLSRIFINNDYYFDLIASAIRDFYSLYKVQDSDYKKIKLSLDNKDNLYKKMLQCIRLYKNYIKYSQGIKEININTYRSKLLSYESSYYSLKDNKYLFSLVCINMHKFNTLLNDYNTLINIKEDFKEVYDFEIFDKRFVSEKDLYKDLDENFVTYYNILENFVPNLLTYDSLDNESNSLNNFGLSNELFHDVYGQELNTDGLFSVLRPYQILGVKYILRQENVLLGDEMGLGKTVQAIATMVSLYNTGERHFVVVAPLSLLENWSREISKHSNLKYFKCHGNKTQRDYIFNCWIRLGGVLITNYESVSKLPFNKFNTYSLVVIDEAHKIKNKKTNRTQACLEIISHSERNLLMTGTALENKKSEMINLISFLNKDLSKTLEHLNSKDYYKAVEPVYYRRKREDVLNELPDLIDTIQWCDLYEDERKIYEDGVMDGKHHQQLRQLSFNSKKSSKLEAIEEIVSMAKDDNRRLVVFSFFLNTLNVIHEKIPNSYIINGSVKEFERIRILDDFDKSPPGTILLLQIESGGTGLNIQSASVVIICEPQFKPSTESQAISRTYRMGQKNSVLVYHLICKDTLEESILNLLESKQSEFDAYADKSLASEKDKIYLKDDDMKSLLDKEIKRIKQKRMMN